jgi:hypothetical protein
MRSIWIKLVLFLCLWYEIAAELHLDGDRSFVLALVVVVLGWFGLRMSGHLIGMLGPNMHRLIVLLVVWLILFWWFAPAVLKALPVVFILAGALAIAVAGARCRHQFELHRHKLDKAYLREHSVVLVALVFAALVPIFFSVHRWGSVWPIIGYTLLPGLPFSFGWQMAVRVGPQRSDAKFGDKDAFRDAGLSEER